jgi:hypothetical protein
MKPKWRENYAHWSPGKALDVVELQAGWCARLREFGVIVKRSFPYDTAYIARQNAQRLAQERWDEPNKSSM